MCPPEGSDGEGYIGAGPDWKPVREVDSLSGKDDSHPSWTQGTKVHSVVHLEPSAQLLSLDSVVLHFPNVWGLKVEKLFTTE